MRIFFNFLRTPPIRPAHAAAAVMLAAAGFASGPAMADKGPCDAELKLCAGGLIAAGIAAGAKVKACQALRTCKKECRVTKRDCKAECRGEKKACKDICRDKHGKGKDYRACRKLCREDKHYCTKNCRSEKRECKDVCRSSYLSPACVAARDVLKTSAVDMVSSCPAAAACLIREQKKEEAAQ